MFKMGVSFEGTLLRLKPKLQNHPKERGSYIYIHIYIHTHVHVDHIYAHVSQWVTITWTQAGSQAFDKLALPRKVEARCIAIKMNGHVLS